MHYRSKLLSLILSVFIVISSFPMNLSADPVDNSGDIIASGTCGDDLIWTFEEEGTLTITGSGDMDSSWTGYMYAPWANYRPDIKSIVINGNVNSIGQYAFYRVPECGDRGLCEPHRPNPPKDRNGLRRGRKRRTP